MADASPMNVVVRDAFVRHQIGLLRVAAGYVEDVQQALDESEPELRRLIEKFLDIVHDERVDLRSTHVQGRLYLLRRRIEELRTRRLRQIEADLAAEQRRLIVAQWLWFAALMGGLGVTLKVPSPTAALTREMVRDIPFQGRTLRQWMRGAAAMDVDRIYAAVVTGLVQGSSRRDIRRAVFGTAALGGRDGATQVTRNGLSAIVTTATAHFAAQANDELVARNDDEFSKETFVAVLDGRTTPTCRALDGRVFRVGEGPIPPLHMHCRSIRVPLPEPTVPPRQTYADWLRSQPAVFQDDVLGKARGALFRRGGLTLDRFVDRNGRQYTLADLAKMDAAAFAAAGLDTAKYTR